MNLCKSSSELKSLARGSLLGKYGTVIGAMLIVEMITLAISFITSNAVNQNNIYGMIIYYAITLITELIGAVFIIGQNSIYLNIACERPYKVSDVFNGFKLHPDKAIIVQLILILISAACILPFGISVGVYYVTRNSLFILMISLLGVLGIILIVYFMLLFSQTYYLLLDFPEYTVRELLTLSKEVMKGNKGRLFYLYISFIPLFLLCLLSCGIGFFFIIPYLNMTLAQFYLNLIECRENNKIVIE